MTYTIHRHRTPGIDGFTYRVRAADGRLVGCLRSLPDHDQCAELDAREQRIAALRAEVDAKRAPLQPAPRASHMQRRDLVDERGEPRKPRRRTNLRAYPPHIRREAILIYNREFQRAQKRLPPSEWGKWALARRGEFLDRYLAQEAAT